MDGPIQNVFPYVLMDGPDTECFSKHTKWMAPYRMFFHTYYMVGPIQNVSSKHVNGWPHTECLSTHVLNGLPHSEYFSKHTKWMAPYRMIIQMY